MTARLQGYLLVLQAVREELHALGASEARLEKNRDEIARVRADLTCGKTGDLTDATDGPSS